MKQAKLLSPALLIPVLAWIAAPASAAPREGDPLAPVVACVAAAPSFKVLERNRLPDTVTSRSVDTAAGSKRVSMVDGYRVILATSQGLPFVNFKIELSEAAAAESDRAAVLAQMQGFSDKRAADAKGLQRQLADGVETLSLDQPTLAYGSLGFHSLFVPQRGWIATIYLLNQEPAKRAFSSYADYEVLRDKAMAHIRGCLVKR